MSNYIDNMTIQEQRDEIAHMIACGEGFIGTHEELLDYVDSFIAKIREDVIEDCMDVVPFRIDDGDYSDGFNDCSKKVLNKLKNLKENDNGKID